MNRAEWSNLFIRLTNHLITIQKWPFEEPVLDIVRCAQSKHRTLAHLRACQEQWLEVVTLFAQRESPSVTILHPWSIFESKQYAAQSWDIHMEKFVEDRHKWLELQHSVDWRQGGKWNRRRDDIGGLTKRLADHETHHLSFFS